MTETTILAIPPPTSLVGLSQTAKTQVQVKWHAANVDEAGVHATALCDQPFSGSAAGECDALAGR